MQFDTRRTPAPQVSLKSQEALSHSYYSARHECNVNRARAEGDTEVHFYHGKPDILIGHMQPVQQLLHRLQSSSLSDKVTTVICTYDSSLEWYGSSLKREN